MIILVGMAGLRAQGGGARLEGWPQPFRKEPSRAQEAVASGKFRVVGIMAEKTF